MPRALSRINSTESLVDLLNIDFEETRLNPHKLESLCDLLPRRMKPDEGSVDCLKHLRRYRYSLLHCLASFFREIDGADKTIARLLIQSLKAGDLGKLGTCRRCTRFIIRLRWNKKYCTECANSNRREQNARRKEKWSRQRETAIEAGLKNVRSIYEDARLNRVDDAVGFQRLGVVQELRTILSDRDLEILMIVEWENWVSVEKSWNEFPKTLKRAIAQLNLS